MSTKKGMATVGGQSGVTPCPTGEVLTPEAAPRNVELPVFTEQFPVEGIVTEMNGKEVKIGFDFVVYLFDMVGFALANDESLYNS